MGIFGEMPMSTKVPTFIGKPIDDIKAVNAELYAKYQKNREAMDAIDIQMSKINAFDKDKPYINELSNSIKSKFNAIKDNPFEVPYANTMISDIFKNDVVMNKKLNAIIKRKSDNDLQIQSILSLNDSLFSEGDNVLTSTGKTNQTKSNKKGYHTKESIDKALLYHNSINDAETIIDENGTILNPIKSYKPVEYIDMTNDLIDALTKMQPNQVQAYIGKFKSMADYHIKQQIETLSQDRIYTLASTILGNNPKFKEWVDQEAFFARIDNTERDENGKLKFTENGELKTNFDVNTLINNKQFRSFLEHQFEKKEKGKKAIPVKEEIGLIGSNNDAFLKYFGGNQKELENKYLSFIKNREYDARILGLAASYSYKKTSYNEIKDNLYMADYESALEVQRNAVVAATEVNTELESKSLLKNNIKKEEFDKNWTILKNRASNAKQKADAKNNLIQIVWNQSFSTQAVLNKIDLTNKDNVAKIVNGLAESIDKGLFENIEDFVGVNNELANLFKVLNTNAINAKTGKPLTKYEKATHVYNTLAQGTDIKKSLSFLSAYSQLNHDEVDFEASRYKIWQKSTSSSSPMIKQIENISKSNNIPTYDNSNRSMAYFPFNEKNITTEGGRVNPNETSQFLSLFNTSANNESGDFYVLGHNVSKNLFLQEGEFKVMQDDGESATVTDKNVIKFRATGGFSKKPIDGYLGIEYEMVDSKGNKIVRTDATGKVESRVLLANSNVANDANILYKITENIKENRYNSVATRNIAIEMQKNLMVNVENINIDNPAPQSVLIALPQNHTGAVNSDIIGNKYITVNKIDDNGRFSVTIDEDTFTDLQGNKTFNNLEHLQDAIYENITQPIKR